MTQPLIDTSQLNKLARDLQRFGPELVKEFRVALSTAGEIVADEARSKISPISSPIAKTIGVKRNRQSVKVQAGGGESEAPHTGAQAAPFENQGHDGTFRAPLFGDYNHWYPHAAHPFLAPAALEKAPEFEAAVLVAVDTAFRAVGFS